MERLMLELPVMYGDHHVTEVRGILLAIPGVQDVYASSCFHVAEVAYDPALTDPETVSARLNEAGYLDDLEVTTEPAQPSSSSLEEPATFRHTTAYQQTGGAISFAQEVSTVGRSLWPCPGLGAIKEDGHGAKRT